MKRTRTRRALAATAVVLAAVAVAALPHQASAAERPAPALDVHRYILNFETGGCLDHYVDGLERLNPSVEVCSAARGQRWVFDIVRLATFDILLIRNVRSGKCIAHRFVDGVKTFDANLIRCNSASTAQQWEFVDDRAGILFRNVASGDVLELRGRRVYVLPYTGAVSQSWDVRIA